MAPNRKIYALKRIRYTGHDQEAARGFIDEISLLKSLRGKDNIIQLLDSEVVGQEGLIYMVLEYGETDLARLLVKQDKQRREEGLPGFDENFVRLYWQQMLKVRGLEGHMYACDACCPPLSPCRLLPAAFPLPPAARRFPPAACCPPLSPCRLLPTYRPVLRVQAVHAVHEMRIVHSDLKPANFLVVEGQLKLIDFGIAKAINGDTTSIARESQVKLFFNWGSHSAAVGWLPPPHTYAHVAG